jgi:hypothetical protein
LREAPRRALRQAAESQRAERDASQAAYRMTHGGAHPLDLTLAPLAERQLEDSGSQLPDPGRRSATVVELDTVAQAP